MELPEVLSQVCLLLLLVIPCLILSNRLRFGSILGLLAAGVVLGPSGLHLVEDADIMSKISELGVVLFMFLIGLELSPERLGGAWKRLVAFGLLQVLVTGGALFAFLAINAPYWQGALLAGGTLAMSSTALVLRMLEDRKQLDTSVGRTAIGILIVQDIAVVPLLALVPILNPHQGASLVENAVGHPIAWTFLAVALLIVAARWIAPPIAGHLGRRGDASSLSAFVALLILGSAFTADSAGLSMPLGAFIAGVSLSTSPQAHKIDGIVRPHQSLLLALFFISIGLSLDVHKLTGRLTELAIAVPCVIIIKGASLYVVSRVMGCASGESLRLSLLLSQAGEFGFVVITTAVAVGWFSAEQAAMATALVAITMAVTPVIGRFIPAGPCAKVTPAG